jgi:hypothetical protein
MTRDEIFNGSTKCAAFSLTYLEAKCDHPATREIEAAPEHFEEEQLL